MALKFESRLDSTVNHVWRPIKVALTPGSMFESRLVTRANGNALVYLSSQAGCKQFCRMCHLTQSGYVDDTNASLTDFTAQASLILSNLVNRGASPPKIKFNFMARGEPLENPLIADDLDNLKNNLEYLARAFGFNSDLVWGISTIIPKTLINKSLFSTPHDPRITIYYSAYSCDEKWRKRWLPNAAPFKTSIEVLRQYQISTGNPVAVHFPVIKGENDDLVMIDEMASIIEQSGLKGKFNLVGYNPPSGSLSEEAPKETRDYVFTRMSLAFGGNGSRVVPRVGYDVKSSCGMFLTEEELDE